MQYVAGTVVETKSEMGLSFLLQCVVVVASSLDFGGFFVGT